MPSMCLSTQRAFLLFFGVCSILSVIEYLAIFPSRRYTLFQQQPVAQRHRDYSAKRNQTKVVDNSLLKKGGDLSWLNRIRPGEWLGSGSSSDSFDAVFDVPMDKEYIIKFTGDYGKGKDGINENYASFSAHAVDVVDRLTPYPSIPETLYFAESVPNPFKRGLYPLPSNDSLDKQNSSGVKALNIERLRKSRNFAVTVSEKVTQTHTHWVHGQLSIPADKVRCFWRQFFDTLAHAHSKSIMMVDTKPWNVLLENGGMKFFDWNLAWIFESKQERRKRHSVNGTRPLHVCSEGETKEKCGITVTCDSVHGYDVRKVGKRIGEFIEVDRQRRSKKNRKTKNYLSRKDRSLLKDMQGLMTQKGDIPTFGWLVNHHDYFAVENSDNCTLLW